MRLDARRETPERLFEEIARQLFGQLIDLQDVGAALREKVAVEGESLEHLLEEWVGALLDLVRLQKMVFAQFHVIELQTPAKGPYTLRAEVTGELWDTQRHHLTQDITRLGHRETHLLKEAGMYHAEIDLGPSGPESSF